MAKINFSEEEGFAKNIAEKVLDDFVYEGKTIREWAKIIMEQEPCEDCVSRQAVLKLFATHDGKYLYEAIRDMPSVKQVPKTDKALPWESGKIIVPLPEPMIGQGHWIDDDDIYKCTACNGLCTVAGWANCISEEQMYKAFKYCPNCGAKMESEGI